MSSSIPQSKRCSKCGETKPVSEFGKDKSRKDGFRSQCKKCHRQSCSTPEYLERHRNYERQRRALPEVLERRRESNNRYYHQHKDIPEIHKRKLEYNRQYRARPEVHEHRREYSYQYNARLDVRKHRREYHQRYYNTPEIHEQRLAYNREHNRQYYKTPEYRTYSRARAHTRAAHKLNLPSTLTNEQWQHALNYFKGCCAVCGRPLRDLFGTHFAAQDHWIPESSPNCPGYIATNIVPLCHGLDGCNNKKYNTMPDVWLEREYGKRKAKQIIARIEAYFRSLNAA